MLGGEFEEISDVSLESFSNTYWRCDRYNIEEDVYFRSAYEIPSCIHDIYSIGTDMNESYALILTDAGLMTFTGENGFKDDQGCITILSKHPKHLFVNSKTSLFQIDY